MTPDATAGSAPATTDPPKKKTAPPPTTSPELSELPHRHGHGELRGKKLWGMALLALGVVYGDIGTSPLYTMKECMHALVHGGTGQIVRSDVLEVLAVRMPVLDTTDILSAKMRVLGEHYCDFTRLLAMTRALREQVDWARLRQETSGHPFARAFLLLVHELGVSPLGPEPRTGAAGA